MYHVKVKVFRLLGIISIAAVVAFEFFLAVPRNGEHATGATQKIVYSASAAATLDTRAEQRDVVRARTSARRDGRSEAIGGTGRLPGNGTSTLNRVLARSAKKYVDGELIVKYKKNRINLRSSSGRTAVSNFSRTRSLARKEDFNAANISLLIITSSTTVEQKIAELRNDPYVEYVEPNYIRTPMALGTDDTYADALWGLDNTGQSVSGGYGTTLEQFGQYVATTGVANADINGPEAWAIIAASSTPIVVAVIDTGVAYNHPEFSGRMWDGSSCKDENGTTISGGCNHGYDYVANDVTPLPTTSSHGTHVAGTIAALKNNTKGIAGVSPNSKIMAIKVPFTTATIIKAIDFAIQNGAKVVNASYGGPTYSSAEYDAISRLKAAGGLLIASAGNAANNNDGGTHNYPSDYDLDNIIAVAATDQNDALATFSSYGATSVDVGAPGTNIVSTAANSPKLTGTFETATPPALPVDWTAVDWGSGNEWGTYDLGVYSNVLYNDLDVPYANNAFSSVVSPAINLSGVSYAAVDFYTYCDSQYSVTATDYMVLEFSPDGSNYSTVLAWDERVLGVYAGTSPGPAGYQFQGVALPGTFTSNARLRFSWITDASDNNYTGCFIDNVVVNAYSDGADELYTYLDGTSMAAPHVSGLAALIKGLNSALTYSQVRTAILSTGTSLASLASRTVTGRRIKADSALQSINPAKAITAFSIAGQSGSTSIDETAHSILLTMPFGSSTTSLSPSITITGASVSPMSGATQNFTNPVVYTVTAADGTTQAYTVTVVNAADPSLKSITAFSFASPAVSGTIEGTNISLQVPYGTSVTNLVASFTTTGASVNIASTTQVSGTTANNFSSPITYTVVAADSSTQNYVVTVTVAQNPAKAITSFSFTTPSVGGTISGTEIDLEVPDGTDVTSLTPTIVITGATLNPASGVARDFTNPVTYTVTAEDSSTQAYTVTVTVATPEPEPSSFGSSQSTPSPGPLMPVEKMLPKIYTPAYIFTHQLLMLSKEREDVAALQRLLKATGDYAGAVTGDYDFITYVAVQRFQRNKVIWPSGIVDARTLNALNEEPLNTKENLGITASPTPE